MRNFCFKCIKSISIVYTVFLFMLSYRLVYNEYYTQINKEIEVSYGDGDFVYALGEIVGLYTECNGVFVIDTCEIESKEEEFINPCKGLLRTGDYILKVNGKDLEEKEILVKEVSECKGEEIELMVIRGEETFITNVTPVMGKNGKYMLGVWVKDDLAGVGTITYYTEEGDFAALGHGMGNGVTKEILSVRGGDVYFADIIGIQKGKKGTPGEVKGVIYYGTSNHIGELDINCSEGIYGTLDKNDIERYKRECDIYKLGNKQEIEIGPAQIISNVSGERRIYNIEIEYVDYLAMTSNKGMHIKIIDSDLLELTGGIVQGMSGSPIIQNGKLVGAVTHVLVNDPTRGYGIFIENMLETS